jgi:hypothetical protein
VFEPILARFYTGAMVEQPLAIAKSKFTEFHILNFIKLDIGASIARLLGNLPANRMNRLGCGKLLPLGDIIARYLATSVTPWRNTLLAFGQN